MKSIDILKKRDELSNQITKYWNIIQIENVVSRNYTRNYDLKQLYFDIVNMCEDRAKYKLKALCINLGFKSFKDIPKENIQLSIFRLAEMKELKVRLGKVRTINPQLKAKKGKNNLNKTEVMTYEWISARKKELDLEITTLEKEITEYNEKHEFDDNSVPSTLIA